MGGESGLVVNMQGAGGHVLGQDTQLSQPSKNMGVVMGVITQSVIMGKNIIDQ